MNLLLLNLLTAITFFFTPIASFAIAEDLSPAVLDLSKEFSQKFCDSVANGAALEKAGDSAAAQLSKSLLFSPVMKEVISSPKEGLVTSLSNNIFDVCGQELGNTQEDLDLYLIQLAKNIPSKTSMGLQLPPTRQKPVI